VYEGKREASCMKVRGKLRVLAALPAVKQPSFVEVVTRWRSWFRHDATSPKVDGSISDNVIEICH
jgi:hypothetical protein